MTTTTTAAPTTEAASTAGATEQRTEASAPATTPAPATTTTTAAPTTTTTTTRLLENNACAADIIFVLDDSFSVDQQADAAGDGAASPAEKGFAYRVQREFVERMVRVLPQVSENTARVAAVSVSTDAAVLFDFDDNGFDRAAIVKAVATSQTITPERSNLHLAIRLIRTTLTASASGSRANAVPTHIVILTDGTSKPSDVEEELELLDPAITRTFFAIGKKDGGFQDDLQTIADRQGDALTWVPSVDHLLSFFESAAPAVSLLEGLFGYQQAAGAGKCAIDMARVNSGVVTTSSTTTTRTTKQKDCTDAFKEDCALWANKNYCVTSAAFMAINCKQSCGTC